jgi:hypothetical protein
VHAGVHDRDQVGRARHVPAELVVVEARVLLDPRPAQLLEDGVEDGVRQADHDHGGADVEQQVAVEARGEPGPQQEDRGDDQQYQHAHQAPGPPAKPEAGLPPPPAQRPSPVCACALAE